LSYEFIYTPGYYQCEAIRLAKEATWISLCLISTLRTTNPGNFRYLDELSISIKDREIYFTPDIDMIGTAKMWIFKVVPAKYLLW
jgi:hypothetical protein